MYSVSGSSGALTYKKGYEQIPANWYRRPTDYTLVNLNLDIVSLITQYPSLGRYAKMCPQPPINLLTGVLLASAGTLEQ